MGLSSMKKMKQGDMMKSNLGGEWEWRVGYFIASLSKACLRGLLHSCPEYVVGWTAPK